MSSRREMTEPHPGGVYEGSRWLRRQAPPPVRRIVGISTPEGCVNYRSHRSTNHFTHPAGVLIHANQKPVAAPTGAATGYPHAPLRGAATLIVQSERVTPLIAWEPDK